MNKLKRPISLLLTLLLLLSIAAVAPVSVSAEVYDGYTYDTSNGEATITGYGGTESELEIPAELEGYTVTAIGDDAFNGGYISSVVIPNTVRTIGDRAFNGCSNLKIAVIPSSVTTIGSQAFENCDPHLEICGSDPSEAKRYADTTSYNFDDSPYYDYSKLNNNEYKLQYYVGSEKVINIESDYNGKSVTCIGSYAFANNPAIERVNIPDGVTHIDAHAFEGCSNLESVRIPASVISIGTQAFFNLDSEFKLIVISGSYGEDYASSNRIDYVEDNSSEVSDVEDFKFSDPIDGRVKVTSYLGAGENVVIPSNYNGKKVTGIDDYAFNNCKSVTSVTVPKGVTSIGDYAFGYCQNLTSISLPETLNKVGQNAFALCTKLNGVTLSDSVYSLGSGAFYNCASLRNIKLSNNIAAIKEKVFEGCSKLESIAIPDSVEEIGIKAFANCTNLKSLPLGKNVEGIDAAAFSGCKDISNITLSSKIKFIGAGAFSNCSNLMSATILYSDATFQSREIVDGTYYTVPIFSKCNGEFKIYGYDPSSAKTYAEENNIPFFNLNEYESNPSTSFYYKNSGDASVTYVPTFEEAWTQATSADNGVVGVLTDVTLSNNLKLTSKRRLTIELNGHVLDRSLVSTQSGAGNGSVIVLAKGTELTVFGGNRSHPEPSSQSSILGWSTKGTIKAFSIKNRGVITGGYTSHDGGGIMMYSNATVNLYYTAVSGNRASGSTGYGFGGGIAIYGANAQINMSHSEVSHNYARNGGGVAFINNDDSSDSYDCVFKGEGKGTLQNGVSVVTSNYAEANGGGLMQAINGCEINGLQFDTNYAGNDGGGLYMNGENGVVKSCTVYENKCEKRGGGICNLGASITTDYNCYTDFEVADNIAGSYGDGIYNDKGVNIGIHGKCYIKNNGNADKKQNFYLNKIDEHTDDALALIHTYIPSNEIIISNLRRADVTKECKERAQSGFVDFDLRKGSVIYITYDPMREAGYSNTSFHSARLSTLDSVTNKYGSILYQNYGNEYLESIKHKVVDESYEDYLFYDEDSNSDKSYCFKVVPTVKSDNKSDGINGIISSGYIERVEGEKREHLPTVKYNTRNLGDYSDLSYNSQPVKGGIYSYPVAGSDFDAQYFYSDGYFMESARIYNNHLATLSACMAHAAMNSTVGSTGDNGNYMLKGKNIRQMMIDMGCKNSDVFLSDTYATKPKKDSIAYCIGSKDLSNGQKLVMIAVRGGGYEAEWAANVKVGATGEHAGFSEAANDVFAGLEDYLDKKGIDGTDSDTKFWIAGYSRAGATSNLTAKRIVDAYDNEGTRTFGYPIEAPKGGVESAKKSGCNYNCIHNVINYCDIVPWVAMGKMGFIRYGKDHFVPGSDVENEYSEGVPHDNYTEILSSDTYNAQKETMLEQLLILNQDTFYHDYFHTATLEYSSLVGNKVPVIGTIIASGKLLQEVKAADDRYRDMSVEEWMPQFWDHFVDYTFDSEDARDEYTNKKPKYRIQDRDLPVLYDGSTDLKTFQESLMGLLEALMAPSQKGDEFANGFSKLNLDEIPTSFFVKVYTNYINTKLNNPLTDATYEDIFIDFWEIIKPKLKEGGVSNEDLARYHEYFYTALRPLLRYVKKDYKHNSQNDLGTLIYNVSNLIQNHDTDSGVPMAWIRSYDDYYTGSHGIPRQIEYTGREAPKPAAVEVTPFGSNNPTTYGNPYYNTNLSINVGMFDEIRFVPDDANYSRDAGDTYYYCFGEPTSDVNGTGDYKWYILKDSFKLDDVSDLITNNTIKVNVFAQRDGLMSNGDKAALYDNDEAHYNMVPSTRLVRTYTFNVTDQSVIARAVRYEPIPEEYDYETSIVSEGGSRTIKGIKPGEETDAVRWTFGHWEVYPYDTSTGEADKNNPVESSQYAALFGAEFDSAAEQTTVTCTDSDNGSYLFEPVYTQRPTCTFMVPDSYDSTNNKYNYTSKTIAYDPDDPVSISVDTLKPGEPAEGTDWEFKGWKVYTYDAITGAVGTTPVSSDQFASKFGESFKSWLKTAEIANLTNESFLFEPVYESYDADADSVIAVPKSYDTDTSEYNYTTVTVPYDNDHPKTVNLKGVKSGANSKFDHWTVYPYDVEHETADTLNPVSPDDYAKLFGTSFSASAETTSVKNLTKDAYLFESSYTSLPYCTYMVPQSYDSENMCYNYTAREVAFDSDSPASTNIIGVMPGVGSFVFDHWTVYPYDPLTGAVDSSNPVSENQFRDKFGVDFDYESESTTVTNLTNGSYQFVPSYDNSYTTNNFIFSVDTDNGVATVAQYIGSSETVVIPGTTTYKNVTYPVVAIGTDAFRDCDYLLDVTINNNIKYIGKEAFLDCDNITSITIPNSVTYIGQAAFAGCTSLESVHVDSLEYWCNLDLSESLFNYFAESNHTDNKTVHYDLYAGNHKITDLTIPSSVTAIKPFTFECCNIRSVNIHDNVTSIGESAFKLCTLLTSITIPDNVTVIGDRAFQKCLALENISIGDGVKRIGAYAFEDCDSLDDPEIGNSVISIGDYAFCDCDSLTKIVIPDSVMIFGYDEYIDDYENYNLDKRFSGSNVFFESTNLVDFTVNGELKVYWGNSKYYPQIKYLTITGDSVSNTMYRGCSTLERLTITDSITNIGSNSFANCKKLKSVDIGSGVETIDSGAFSSTGLASVTIPDNVITLGNSAFASCTSMVSATIGNGVETVSEKAFESCRSLIDLTLGSSVEVIDKNAFSLTGLNSLTIPESVETINDYAFRNCNSLESLTINSNSALTDLSEKAFTNCGNLINLTTPGNGSFSYYNLPKATVEHLTITGDSIKNSAFIAWPRITEIVIPNSVRTVGVNAFAYCKQSLDVTIGDNVETLPASAFSNSKVETISLNGNSSFDYNNLPKSTVTNITVRGELIKQNAFSGFPELMHAHINETVSSIGVNAFSNCPNLMDVNIPDAVTSINDGAFQNCVSLETVTLGDELTRIGERAFSGCKSLPDITLPNSVSVIDTAAFSDCSSLTGIAIPDKVQSVGSRAFNNCTSLRTALFHEGVQSIGSLAFNNCSNMVSVSFPSTLKIIGKTAFNSCSKLQEVSIPKGVNSIGSEAFENCTDLETAFVWGRTTTVGGNVFAQCPDLTIYAYDSSPTDTYALGADIPFFPIVNTNLGNGYDDEPITDTQTAEDGDSGFGLYLDVFNNLELLGVQLKTDEGTNDMRFVAVLNEGIVAEATRSHDIEDYGFVIAKTRKNSTYSVGEENIQKINLGAPNTMTLSCRKTSNKVSGDYGIYSKSNTKYKYITLGVKNVDTDPNQGLAVRFYVKTHSGRIYYANYITDFTGCAASYSLLFEGDNSTLFRDEWNEMAIKEDE